MGCNSLRMVILVKMRRHTFVAFVLLAALASVFFSGLLPSHGISSRNHVRTYLAMATAAPVLVFGYAYLSRLSQARLTRAVRSDNLIDLHCARIC